MDAVEPYHAVVYFAPEVRAAFEAVGLRGFWRGYFAGRAAPLGPVGAGVVTACFFGFRADFVARAVPEIWSTAPPDVALDARRTGVDAALGRLLDVAGQRVALVEAAALLREAATGGDLAGRPLYAANLGLGWPAEPHLALWHGATLLREHRGDGHVAALVAAGFDPCEAHVSQVAAAGASSDTLQPYRGWGTQEWDDAAERLRARGWLDSAGRLTPAGRAAREAVERDTDRLAAEPVQRLTRRAWGRLVELLDQLVAPVIRSGTIPYPNAMGVPKPSHR